MSGKTWKGLDIVLGLVAGIAGTLGIVTSIKAAGYDEEQQFKDFEERYGLTPVSTEESE